MDQYTEIIKEANAKFCYEYSNELLTLRKIFWVTSILLLLQPVLTIEEANIFGVIFSYNSGSIQNTVLMIVYSVLLYTYLRLISVEFDDQNKLTLNNIESIQNRLTNLLNLAEAELDDIEHMSEELTGSIKSNEKESEELSKVLEELEKKYEVTIDTDDNEIKRTDDEIFDGNDDFNEKFADVKIKISDLGIKNVELKKEYSKLNHESVKIRNNTNSMVLLSEIITDRLKKFSAMSKTIILIDIILPAIVGVITYSYVSWPSIQKIINLF